jgi:hypothetical protein
LAAALVIIDEPPLRVGELEVWKPFSDLRAGRVSIREAGSPGMPERCRRIEAVVIPFYRHGHSFAEIAHDRDL